MVHVFDPQPNLLVNGQAGRVGPDTAHELGEQIGDRFQELSHTGSANKLFGHIWLWVKTNGTTLG